MNKRQLDIIKEDCINIINRVGNDFYKLEGRKVLITGASGMLPSYFLDTINILNKYYFETPCEVIGIIHTPISNYNRLRHLKNEKNIRFITQNIAEKLYIDENIDYIIHAASKASPKAYLEDPIDTIYTNLNGIKSILDYSIKNNVEGILYFSSGEIYGNPTEDNIPTPEEYEGRVLCTGDRACYTETKRFCETLIVNYVKTYNLHAKIVRPWHVFGPGMKLDDGRVIADFIRNGLNGDDIEILSDGLSTRAFCYITDAHVGFWKILFSKYDGQAFNIGNDESEIKIKKIAEIICDLFNNTIKYTIKNENEIEYLKSSPVRCCPNINKAKKLLDYQPEIDLESMLKRMINFYKEKSNNDEKS